MTTKIQSKIISKRKKLDSDQYRRRIISSLREENSKLLHKVSYWEKCITRQLGDQDICPVTLEPFNFDNPPYCAYLCKHRFSHSVFKKLPVYTLALSNKQRTTYQICPVCKTKIRFAFLDFAFIELSILKKNVENFTGENEMKAKEITSRKPHFLSPLGGCLTPFGM